MISFISNVVIYLHVNRKTDSSGVLYSTSLGMSLTWPFLAWEEPASFPPKVFPSEQFCIFYSIKASLFVFGMLSRVKWVPPSCTGNHSHSVRNVIVSRSFIDEIRRSPVRRTQCPEPLLLAAVSLTLPASLPYTHSHTFITRWGKLTRQQLLTVALD